VGVDTHVFRQDKWRNLEARFERRVPPRTPRRRQTISDDKENPRQDSDSLGAQARSNPKKQLEAARTQQIVLHAPLREPLSQIPCPSEGLKERPEIVFTHHLPPLLETPRTTASLAARSASAGWDLDGTALQPPQAHRGETLLTTSEKSTPAPPVLSVITEGRLPMKPGPKGQNEESKISVFLPDALLLGTVTNAMSPGTRVEVGAVHTTRLQDQPSGCGSNSAAGDVNGALSVERGKASSRPEPRHVHTTRRIKAANEDILHTETGSKSEESEGKHFSIGMEEALFVEQPSEAGCDGVVRTEDTTQRSHVQGTEGRPSRKSPVPPLHLKDLQQPDLPSLNRRSPRVSQASRTSVTPAFTYTLQRALASNRNNTTGNLLPPPGLSKPSGPTRANRPVAPRPTEKTVSVLPLDKSSSLQSLEATRRSVRYGRAIGEVEVMKRLEADTDNSSRSSAELVTISTGPNEAEADAQMDVISSTSSSASASHAVSMKEMPCLARKFGDIVADQVVDATPAHGNDPWHSKESTTVWLIPSCLHSLDKGWRMS
jgi:hypothetical protein